MNLNSTLTLFYMNLLLGVMLSLSSNNWMIIWMGMEISLMCFIPTMISKEKMSSESSMKYFIIQGMSSSIFIFGLIMTMMQFKTEFIIEYSMLIKMGVSPFHNWVISMIEGMNYMPMYTLLTILKFVPIWVMMNIQLNNQLFIILTLTVGAVSGLNQNSMRKLIAYSSIFNMGFILYAMKNMSTLINYLMIYSMLMLMLTYFLKKINVNYVNQMMYNKFDLKIKLTLWTLMLSMGGMPPMMGFINKLMVIEMSILMKEWMLTMTMIFSSLMTMFYYNRMCFTSMMINSMTTKWMVKMNLNITIMTMFSNILLSPIFISMNYLI